MGALGSGVGPFRDGLVDSLVLITIALGFLRVGLGSEVYPFLVASHRRFSAGKPLKRVLID